MPRMPGSGLGRVALVLAALAARPAVGARLLYATASGGGRVDVFPLDGNGGVLPRQSTVGTSGTQPRRIVVDRRADGTSCTLYAAELDRIEAFRIGPAGDLRPIGTTDVNAGADPHDIAVGPDVTAPQFLYVPQLKPSRIVAYALLRDGSRNDGAPESKFSSCVQGKPATTYQAIAIENGLIYVSSTSPGRIEAYLPATDGIAGKVCREQNPERLSLGPGTADALAVELNPNNVQCNPDPRQVEQFPVVDPATSDKAIVKFLHVDPADTGTNTEEGVQLNKVKKESHNQITNLSPRVYFTCPDKFLPDNCDVGSRTEDPTNRASCPVSTRRIDGGAIDIALDGLRVYVDQHSTRILSSIQLQSDSASGAFFGAFDPFICKLDKKAKTKDSPFCTTDSAMAALVDPQSGMRTEIGQVRNKRIKQSKAASKLDVVGNTNPLPQLSSLYFDPAHQRLYAPQFNQGVVASYRVIVDQDGKPKVEHVKDTKQDLRSSPFRVTVDGSVLYVAAGSFDRVQAFQLDSDGTPASTPFSWSNVPKGSFPNDVVVAVPGADCPN